MAYDNLNIHSESIAALIKSLRAFKDIGPKMAERIAYEIVKAAPSEIETLLNAINTVRDTIRFCSSCNGYSSGEKCHICSDSNRDNTKLCIVESPDDILAIERSRNYKGLYYSLSDCISVSQGKGLDKLVLLDLIEKVKKDNFIEIILATNTDLDGDLTANMIKENLKNIPDLKISRLAFGLPVGADIKLADSATLIKSFEGRSEL